MQKEEPKKNDSAPPPPVLHSKKERSRSEKKKQPEKEVFISTENKNDSHSALTKGTQNSRIKAAQSPMGGSKTTQEPDKAMVPNESKTKPETGQCKNEVKTNVPWYLQE